MRDVIVSVAPIAAIEQDIIPEKIAEDVIQCYQAGASMVHLHVRDKNGHLTSDLSVLEETVRLIRKETDIIIQASTGGVSDLTIQERCTPVSTPWVEANSLNVGSVNLGDSVYINRVEDVDYCVEQIIKNQKIPEIEVFEIGMIKTVQELAERFDFIKPILFSIVLGHKGAAPATSQTLRSMIAAIDEFFPYKANRLWGITHANRRDFSIMEEALDLGASTVRIGFEDSSYLDENTQAGRNLPLIEKVISLIKEHQLSVATPQRAREMLHIAK